MSDTAAEKPWDGCPCSSPACSSPTLTCTGVGVCAGVSIAMCSFCMERSYAAELCLNLMFFP